MRNKLFLIMAFCLTLAACNLPYNRYAYVPIETTPADVVGDEVFAVPQHSTYTEPATAIPVVEIESPTPSSIPPTTELTNTFTVVVITATVNPTTSTVTGSPTFTNTVTFSRTQSRTSTQTLTSTVSRTPTQSSTPTRTVSVSPGTPTRTATSTSTQTPSSTYTPTRTTQTATLPSPTVTRSRTATRTATNTPTSTLTRTPSHTAQPTTPPPPTQTPTNTITIPPGTPTYTRTNTSAPSTTTFTLTPTPTATSTVVVPSAPPPTQTQSRTPTSIPPTATAAVCNPVQNSGYESQVIALINNERANVGVAPLSGQSQLGNAARGHSQDMACNRFFSHTGSDGSAFSTRISRAGYSYSAAAENIAAGYGDPVAVVAGWMGSQGHKDNMLNPNYTEVGIGYIYVAGSPYGVYWTTNFGRP